MRTLLTNLLAVAGGIAVVVGVALVSAAAAWIVGGALAIVAAWRFEP